MRQISSKLSVLSLGIFFSITLELFSNVSAALPITASGIIYEDDNDNASKDTGEDVYGSAVTTRLFKDGTETDSQNGTGAYSYSLATAGDYEVRGIVPDGYKNAGETFVIDLGTVDDNTANITLNIGFVPVVNIGNIVYEELDGIAGFSAGDTGINGITVKILDDSGAALSGVDDQVTASKTINSVSTDGVFEFLNLPAGSYTVELDKTTVPSKYQFNTPNNGSHSTGALTAGQDYYDFDFALELIPTATINGQIWEDKNADSEIGTDEIFDTTNYTTSTNSTLVVREVGETTVLKTINTTDGTFSFANLDPAKLYEIELLTLPSLYLSSNANIIATDSAVGNGVFGTSFDFEIKKKPTGNLGGIVFVDLDNSETQETEEIGLKGITMVLFESNGTTIFDEATTDTNGRYVFENLQDGSTYIVKIKDENLATGGALEGLALTTGQTNNQETTETYDAADPQGDILFGYNASSVSGFVWEDTNRDGTLDSGETLISGVKVSLKDDNGTIINQITTGTDGSYNFLFSDLGDYEIVLDQDNFFVSGVLYEKGQTTDFVQNGNPVNEISITQNGTILVDQNWGYAPGVISGIVWQDENFDKIQADTETLIQGVQIDLLDVNLVKITSQTTAADGTFSFDDIPAGTYTIRVADSNFDTGEVLENYGITNVDTGSANFALEGGAVKDDISFGYEQSAIQGHVFRDSNGDGDITGDAGLGGVELELLDETGVAVLESDGVTPVKVVTVDDGTDNGFYSFENFANGSYKIKVSDSNFVTGGILETLNPTNDISSTVFEITDREVFFDQNIGYETSGIGDLVFWDVNGNGIFDAGTDSGIAGVTVTLINSVLDETTTVTDSNGGYSFNVPSGTYTLEIGSSNFEEGSVLENLFSENITTTGGSSRTVNTVFGESYGDADFGIGKSSIQGSVWLDEDQDATIDEEETLIENVIVTIELTDGTVKSTLTDSDGSYKFENLPPGDFVISIDTDQENVKKYDLLTSSQTKTIESAGTQFLAVDFALTVIPPTVVVRSKGTARICQDCKDQIKVDVERAKRAPVFCSAPGNESNPACTKHTSTLFNPAPEVYHSWTETKPVKHANTVQVKNNFIGEVNTQTRSAAPQMKTTEEVLEVHKNYGDAAQNLLNRNLITDYEATHQEELIPYPEAVKLMLHAKGIETTYYDDFAHYEGVLKARGFQNEETNTILYRSFGYISQEKAIFLLARANGILSAEEMAIDSFWFDRYKIAMKDHGLLTSQIEELSNPFYKLTRKEFYYLIVK